MRNNSSKISLFLMELIIAIFFFSLAGAICIQLFVRSHVISNNSVELSYSVLWVQNVAETFYGCNGDAKQIAAVLNNPIMESNDGKQTITILLDSNFKPLTSEEKTKALPSDFGGYHLTAVISEDADLRTCDIMMENPQTTKPIYSLKVTLFPDKEADNE